MSNQLILASASPQRRAILERVGVQFSVRPADVDELQEGDDPGQVALENALRKARAIQAYAPRATVLGVDTLVALGADIYGKPAHEQAARVTLTALSGNTHSVFSGLAVLREGRERVTVAQTLVSFRACSSEMIDWYVSTGEWRGRAGGYAIQGAGAVLVREIHGDYENVVGLPLASLLDICPELL